MVRLIFRISVGAVRRTLWELSECFGAESKAKQVGAGNNIYGGGIGRRMGCSGDGNTDKNVRYCSQGFNSQQPEQTPVHVRCKSLPVVFYERSKNMTVRELYEWAEEHEALDYDIEIPYRDDGGYYYGCDDAEPCIEERYNKWNTEQVVNL